MSARALPLARISIVLGLALTSNTIVAQQYAVVDVGVLGRCESIAHGLNNLGQVVGESADANYRTYAFVTEPNGAGIRSLGGIGFPIGQPISVARAINDIGQVVGTLGNGDGAFISAPNGGALSRLTPPAGTGSIYAWNINQSGHVVGQSQPTYAVNPSRAPFHAFITAKDGGLFTDVGAFPSTFNDNETYGRGVNTAGQVVGGATGYCSKGGVPGYLCGSFSTGAGGGGLASLGALGPDSPYARGNARSYALGINDKGQVIGYSDTANFGPIHAYISDGTTLTDLGTFGGLSSQANGINNAGQVVGQYVLTGGLKRAFIWDNKNGMVDLNTQIDPASGWTLTEAVAINDKGQIAANAENPKFPNCPHAVLVTCKDTDGDGLCDDWEKNGVTVQTANGPVLLDLPAMGSDPLHKDIFVQVDYFVAPDGTSRSLPIKALNFLIDAFRNAPVDNPDKQKGINIHVDCGWNCIMNPKTSERWGTSGTTISKSSAITESPALALLDEATVFDTLKTVRDTNFANAAGTGRAQERVGVFHHAVIAGTMVRSDGCGGLVKSGGRSDQMPGQFFVVTPGMKPGDVVSGLVVSDEFYTRAIAGTFMHELGHNLGLRHGGPGRFSATDKTIDITNKPNQFSVMNYSWQTGLSKDNRWTIDYSPFDNPSLNENGGLVEADGIKGVGDVDRYRVKYFCPNPGIRVITSKGGNHPINWNCSTRTDIDSTPVKSNINGDYPDCSKTSPIYSTLTNYNEWKNLVYVGGAVGGAGTGILPAVNIAAGSPSPGEADPDEMFRQLLVTMRIQADLNDDGQVDLDDLALLQSQLNKPISSITQRTDLNLDGKIDALDARMLTTLCTKPRCAK